MALVPKSEFPKTMLVECGEDGRLFVRNEAGWPVPVERVEEERGCEMGEDVLEDVMGADAAVGIERFMDALKRMRAGAPGCAGDACECALDAARVFAKAGEPLAVSMCLCFSVFVTRTEQAETESAFDLLFAQARANARRGKEASGE